MAGRVSLSGRVCFGGFAAKIAMMLEEKVSINGLEVYYKIHSPLIWKKGCSVLILHGWGGSSGSWVKVQRILAKKGYQVAVLDFPGFGRTKTPPFPWGLAEYSDFILKFAEEIGFKKFFLVGHSFGGRIAVKFTVNHPEMVERLILCDSAGIIPKMGLTTRLTFIIARIGNAIFTPKILRRFRDGARNVFYIFLRHKDYVKAEGTMKEVMKKVIYEDLLPELSQIKVKTLLVWGEADRLVPLKYGRIFNEKIAGSELVVLPKIGHSPNLEVPNELTKHILAFLSQKER